MGLVGKAPASSEEKVLHDPRSLSLRCQISFLVKDAAVYGLTSAISRVASLLTFPLIARSLSPAEYGSLDLLQVFAAFLALLIVFGQDSAIARFFYESDSISWRRQVISQSLWLQFMVVALLVPILWMVARPISETMLNDAHSYRLVQMIIVQAPFIAMINVSASVLRLTFRKRRYVTLTLGYSAFQAGLWIAVVLSQGGDLFGIVLMSVFASATFGIIGVYFVRDWLDPPKGGQALRAMLLYAAPYGLVSCIEAFSPIAQRGLTQELLGTVEMGFLAVGVKIATLASLVVYAFQAAWTPFALSLHKQPDAPDTYRMVLKLLTLIVCLLALALAALASPLIFLLASDRYAAAAPVVFPLTMGIGITAIGWVTEFGITISKQSHLKLLASIVGFAAMVLSILALARNFGVVGVAFGTLVGQGVRVLLLSHFAQRAFPIPWGWQAPILLGLSVIGGAAGIAVEAAWGWEAGALINVAAMLGIAFFGVTLLLSNGERHVILRTLQRR